MSDKKMGPVEASIRALRERKFATRKVPTVQRLAIAKKVEAAVKAKPPKKRKAKRGVRR